MTRLVQRSCTPRTSAEIAIDDGTAIALDPAGNAYVVGITFSTNFPTVNPFQATKGAQQDAFVAKINPAGSAWVYATYLGGNDVDEGYGIAVRCDRKCVRDRLHGIDQLPRAVCFPGLQCRRGRRVRHETESGRFGAGVFHLFGRFSPDYGTAIAVDASGSAYVTGIVTSDDFPLANPIDATLGSHAVDDVFVTKFNPSGSALVYSTYLGGGSGDDAYAIALDQAGNAYITGRTNSSDFPLVNPIQVTRVAFDMFVTEINAAGSALLFSTFVGGSGSESGRGIAVDFTGEHTHRRREHVDGFPRPERGSNDERRRPGWHRAAVCDSAAVVFNDFTGKGRSGGESSILPRRHSVHGAEQRRRHL